MAYLLSKILPVLLALGLSVILLVVGLIGRWLAQLSPLLCCSGSSPGAGEPGLWRWLEFPWQRCSALEALQADAIVVLSGGRHPAPERQG